MFGYVVINKPELKIKDYEAYQSYYCGLCRSLKKRHGFLGQMTLNYDMTMAVILLSGLYEPETTEKRFRCLVHPTGRHTARQNRFTDYAADMNVLMAYEKAMDDVLDEKKVSARLLSSLLRPKAKKVRARYPRQAAVITENLRGLNEAEKRGETDLDTLAGYFGRIMETIVVFKEDYFLRDLSRFGFFLGKFIYLLDAYDDMEQDIKNGCFNPLTPMKDRPDFEERVEEILEMMMAESARAFEMLPIIEGADILRNIIYGGVWTKYLAKKQKVQKKSV